LISPMEFERNSVRCWRISNIKNDDNSGHWCREDCMRLE
jgi:hypothetical protein